MTLRMLASPSTVERDGQTLDVSGDVAIAMGNYFFTSTADGSKTKVEYTLVVDSCKEVNGQLYLPYFSQQPHLIFLESFCWIAWQRVLCSYG